jgi:hypothetical protein
MITETQLNNEVLNANANVEGMEVVETREQVVAHANAVLGTNYTEDDIVWND